MPPAEPAQAAPSPAGRGAPPGFAALLNGAAHDAEEEQPRQPPEADAAAPSSSGGSGKGKGKKVPKFERLRVTGGDAQVLLHVLTPGAAGVRQSATECMPLLLRDPEVHLLDDLDRSSSPDALLSRRQLRPGWWATV